MCIIDGAVRVGSDGICAIYALYSPSTNPASYRYNIYIIPAISGE